MKIQLSFELYAVNNDHISHIIAFDLINFLLILFNLLEKIIQLLYLDFFFAPNDYFINQFEYRFQFFQLFFNFFNFLIVLLNDQFQFILSLGDIAILLFYTPDEHIRAYFQVVFNSWYSFGRLDYLVYHFKEFKSKHFVNIINKTYILTILCHVDQ